MTGPLAELVDDLERHGKPSLAWVTRWSADGREPLAAAWDAAPAGDLRYFASWLFIPQLVYSGRRGGLTYCKPVAFCLDHLRGASGGYGCALCASGIRRVAPTPPTTLAALIRKHAARHTETQR